MGPLSFGKQKQAHMTNALTAYGYSNGPTALTFIKIQIVNEGKWVGAR